MATATEHIREQFYDFINRRAYPCSGAKSALTRDNIHVNCYGDMSANSQTDSIDLLADLYQFISNFDLSRDMYSSFVAIFSNSTPLSDLDFEKTLWRKLQELHDLDAMLHPWDDRVSCDIRNKDFSFSVGENAFFIIGLNPESKRKSRQFEHPAIVFNLHSQFEKLREEGRFTQFRDHIRKKDAEFCNQPNPMLANHGEDSEVLQYSGRHLEADWQCPLKIRKHI